MFERKLSFNEFSLNLHFDVLTRVALCGSDQLFFQPVPSCPHAGAMQCGGFIPTSVL